MRSLTAVDLLAHGFAALTDDEQEEALIRLRDIQLTRLSEAQTEAAAYLRGLRRVAELSGGELTPDLYKRMRVVLAGEGEELPPLSAVIRHYSTWALAKRAAGLAELTTVDVVESRFRQQLVGLNPHYSHDELAHALERCAAEVGRAPLVSEYEAWRRKELALMATRGEHPRVPGADSFRRRFATWERALRSHGFSTDDLYLRLESPERSGDRAKVWRYTDAALAEALHACVAAVGRAPLVEEYAAWRRRELAERGGEIPSDSPFRRRFGTWEQALARFGCDAAS